MPLSDLAAAVDHRLNYAAQKFRSSPQWADMAITTKRNYERYIGYIKGHFGDYADLGSISADQVKHFLGTFGDRPATAGNVLIVLRNLLRYGNVRDITADTIRLKDYKGPSLIQREKVYVNRAKANGTTVQEEKGGFAAWTEEDFWKFTSLCAKWHIKMYVMLARFTGQRVIDLIQLKWDAVDMTDGYIKLQQEKTGKVVMIPIHKFLRGELERNLRFQRANKTYKPDGYLICHTSGDEKGQPYRREAMSHAVVREANALLGKNLAPHGLRKLMAVSLAEKGASEYEIMSITGHTDPASVRHYVIDAKQKKLADEAMKKLQS